MKTDRFSDIIRRKLESIRPEFSEKDWARMQSSLQTGMPQPATSPASNPFAGGMWTAKPWLMAAASVGAVAMVSYGFWQQREISQLRHTISELKKSDIHQPRTGHNRLSDAETLKLTRQQADKTSATGQVPSGSSVTDADQTADRQQLRRDTVYITRYITVPSKSNGIPPNDNRSADRLETVTEQREQRYAASNQGQQAVARPNPSDNLTNNPKTDAYGASSTPSIISENLTNSSVASEKATNKASRERRPNRSYRNDREMIPGQDVSGDAYSSTYRTRIKEKRSRVNQTPYDAAPGESAYNQPTQVWTSARFEPVSSLPLSSPNTNWANLLVQRARRMRPARTTVVGGTIESATAPESQQVARVGSVFRVGVGGELASKLTGIGVVTEVLMGKRWSVSVGLSQVTYKGDKFVSDFDFDIRMRRDFRKEFARSIDPHRDIFNIATQTTRWQAPVSITYRIPLGRSLAFTPTLGTYINLSSTEEATYYCPVPIPQRGYEELSFSDKRTVPFLSSVAIGTGLEWQQGHWVLQGSPVLTLPIKETQEGFQPNPNWQSSALIGLRARLLYQF